MPAWERRNLDRWGIENRGLLEWVFENRGGRWDPKGIRKTKKPAQGGLSVMTWRSVVQIIEYGAADGTRTRDPRRDRPVF